jgi:ABC-type dipeptide/oligopeptide/nickel transport system permease subunit
MTVVDADATPPNDREDIDQLAPAQSSRRMLARALLRSPSGMVGAVVFVSLAVMAVFAPWIAPHDPLDQNLRAANTPPVWSSGGTWEFVLGTDSLGRDLLSRIIFGARVSLAVAVGGVAIALLAGLALGAFAGYVGGRVDRIIVSANDLVLSVPYTLLVVVVAAVVGNSLFNVILIFGITDIPIFLRVTRGEVLKLSDSTFVEAARAVGVPRRRILVSHLVPNLVGPLATLATFEMSSMILYEAGLSFLGLSVPPSVPSWGNMIDAGRDTLEVYPWISIAPGVAIIIAGLGLNLLGDWSRDALDPRTRRVRR